MSSIEVMVIIVIVVALLFDFVNGWNDSANAIATVVATRVLSPLKAVMLAAVLNLSGAMFGTSVANTMANLIYPEMVPQHSILIILIAGLLAAGVWAAVMTVYGMPISGSHSLVGGIVGSAVAAAGVDILVGKTVAVTLAAMLIAPVLGFFVAYCFYVGLMWLTRRLRPSTMKRAFGKAQVVSAGWMAFTHGTNDAQKVMGIITLALIMGGFQDKADSDATFVVETWVKITCGAMISIGTAVGGWKVIKTLGHHLTKLEAPEGFAAETSASLVLTIAAWAGIPTSTTHTITGSILGIGATRGMSSVKWGLGEKILLAWVFTLPSTAALGGALYWILSGF